jgi:hypothetical protein
MYSVKAAYIHKAHLQIKLKLEKKYQPYAHAIEGGAQTPVMALPST